MLKQALEKIGVPFLAAVLALISAGTTPWWWERVFSPTTKRPPLTLWSCGWGNDQDAAMGIQCPQGDPLHFHLAIRQRNEDEKFCTSIDLAGKLAKGEKLVSPTDLEFSGPRPGSKFESHRPESMKIALNGNQVVICGYHVPPTTFVNTDTHYLLTYNTVGGPPQSSQPK